MSHDYLMFTWLQDLLPQLQDLSYHDYSVSALSDAGHLEIFTSLSFVSFVIQQLTVLSIYTVKH